MSNLLLSFGLVIILNIIFSLVSYRTLEPRWINEVKLSWKSTNLIALASGVVLGLTSVLLVGTFDYRVLALMTLGWISGIVFVTDYSNYSIPRGVSYFSLIPATIALAWAYFDTGNSEVFIASGLTMLLPIGLFFSTGIGMGDVRLFTLVALATPWWFTLSGWTYALLITSVLGLISFVFAYAFKMGQLIEYGKPVASKSEAGEIPKVEKKKKRAVPFGPPILAGYIFFGIYMLIIWGETMPASIMQSPLN